MPGTLFVVATPIGNLEDITYRAVRTLREVDLIAAEDTRRTAKLLAHLDIHKPMVSLHEHNEFREAPKLVAWLLSGANIALVSDAGTPGIADPGARLVRAAREAGLTPVPIPGPSAITAALSVAGIEGSSFVFMGFPPPKGSDRIRWFARLKMDKRAVVFFESPHRIAETLSYLHRIYIERQIDVLREITKINYELVKQTNLETAMGGEPVGEFVVVVHERAVSDPDESAQLAAHDVFGQLTENGGVSSLDAQLATADILNIADDAVDLAIRRGEKLVKKQKMDPR